MVFEVFKQMLFLTGYVRFKKHWTDSATTVPVIRYLLENIMSQQPLIEDLNGKRKIFLKLLRYRCIL